MKKLITAIFATWCGLSFAHTPTSTQAPVTLHLVGDSTMSDKPNLAYPERGWGQLLPEYLSPTIRVFNHAANGRSTKRFVDEGRWNRMLSELRAGDYVLIQFGHNDQKASDPARYADVKTAYPEYLTQFIRDVRAKDATPMIASSICRRHFDEEGQLKRTLTEYANAARQVAELEDVDFIPMNTLSCNFLAEIGEPDSNHYFIKVPPDLYTRYPEGKTDNTHLNTVGAAKIAQLFVRELQRQELSLSEFVYRDTL